MYSNNESSFAFSDLNLARRLERTEATANAEFVEARAKFFPSSGACWMECAGAYAMFDGVGSPLTQTFGLGVFEPVTAETLDRIEEFYRQRGSEVFHEISPMSDPSLLTLLGERGYRPIEVTSVMFRPIGRNTNLAIRVNDQIRIRLIGKNDDSAHELWAQTAAKGWAHEVEFGDLVLDLSRLTVKKGVVPAFLAELNSKAVATGALSITDGVALLAGASTIPEARKQGAQLALLDTRLRYAAEQGCDLAMMCALPGSASQRNAERQGFRIAYTRIKWQAFK
ncbi:MAG: GNAT family N-acetyltransferase [Acidobacteria bacterium]|nr:GNAT family N-acetyltransferase [Acidobacteriota bacterium]